MGMGLKAALLIFVSVSLIGQPYRGIQETLKVEDAHGEIADRCGV
jgi:hypothetical protein